MNKQNSSCLFMLFFILFSWGNFITLSAQSLDTLKVMTYNILHGAPPGLQDSVQKIDLEKVAKVIKKVNPDLVALQEVDSMWSRSDNQYQAKALSELTGLKYYHYSDSRSFLDHGVGYGIALLSRYKIKNPRTLFLPYYHHPGTENWVNSEAVIELPNGKELLFVSIHYDYIYKENRVLEALATNNAIRRSKLPVILAGDFNATPEEKTIKILEEQYFRTCTKCKLTWPSDRPRQKLDYIFYSKGSPLQVEDSGVIRNTETRFASDHFPYYTVFSWKK